MICLAKENRARAVSACAAAMLARKVVESICTGEPERTLAAVEWLCLMQGGHDVVVVLALGRRSPSSERPYVTVQIIFTVLSEKALLPEADNARLSRSCTGTADGTRGTVIYC